MIVGSLRVRFLIRESRSLKDKRQVVRSVKDRLRNQFNISVAEIEALDHLPLVFQSSRLAQKQAHTQGAYNHGGQ